MTIVFTVSTADERYLCVQMYIGLWFHTQAVSVGALNNIARPNMRVDSMFLHKSQMMWIQRSYEQLQATPWASWDPSLKKGSDTGDPTVLRPFSEIVTKGRLDSAMCGHLSRCAVVKLWSSDWFIFRHGHNHYIISIPHIRCAMGISLYNLI